MSGHSRVTPSWQRFLGQCLFAGCSIVLIVSLAVTLRIWLDTSHLAALSAPKKSCAVTVTMTASVPPNKDGNPQPPTASPDEIQKAFAASESCLENNVESSLADQKALMDRLVTLVSIYSVLLGAAALFNLKLARDDADKQVTAIKEISEKAKFDFDRALADLPGIRRMSDAVQELMASLIGVLGPELNWNDDQAYKALGERERQKVILGEVAVGALRIFAQAGSTNNVADLARIYRSFARFYYGKYTTNNLDEAAFSRATLYLDDSKRLQPDDAGTYRLLGAIYVGRSNRLRAEDWEEKKACLDKADAYCRKAVRLDERDLGAYYNLALALYLSGQRDDAVNCSESALKNTTIFDDQHTRKYLASAITNLACFHAKADGQSSSPQNVQKVLETLVRGKQILADTKLSNVMDQFKSQLLRELAAGGDFNLLPDDARAAIRRLIEET